MRSLNSNLFQLNTIRALALLTIIVVVGGLLSACGESPLAAESFESAQPCHIVESQAGIIAKKALIPAADSPPYCNNDTVDSDYSRAERWYQAQVKNNSYPPTMSDEAGQYYTGTLLADTRTSLFYNQQAGRVVLAHWTAGQDFDHQWAKDGTSITLIFAPQNYQKLSFPLGHPEQATVTKANRFAQWYITLVYDAKAAHWKMKEAVSKLVAPS